MATAAARRTGTAEPRAWRRGGARALLGTRCSAASTRGPPAPRTTRLGGRAEPRTPASPHTARRTANPEVASPPGPALARPSAGPPCAVDRSAQRAARKPTTAEPAQRSLPSICRALQVAREWGGQGGLALEVGQGSSQRNPASKQEVRPWGVARLMGRPLVQIERHPPIPAIRGRRGRWEGQGGGGQAGPGLARRGKTAWGRLWPATSWSWVRGEARPSGAGTRGWTCSSRPQRPLRLTTRAMIASAPACACPLSAAKPTERGSPAGALFL